MGDYSAIACTEVTDSFSETSDIQNGMNFSVEVQCAASDRFALMSDVLENSRPYPKFTGFNVFPSTCSARPLGGEMNPNASGQEIAYTGDAIVRINYSTLNVELASESLEPYINYTTLDNRFFRWSNGTTGTPVQEGEAGARIDMGLNILRTRYRLAAIPNEVLTCLGGVNRDPYVSASLGGLTFAPETLLFQPQNVCRSFNTFSSVGFTCTIKFQFNPNGWNTYWRSETQAWESQYFYGSGSRFIQYPLLDFGPLTA